MAIIETCNYSNQNLDSQGNFEIPSINQKSKTAEYLESLYSYPPKIKIKWNNLDKLNNSPHSDKTKDNRPDNFPFSEFVDDWFFNGGGQALVQNEYKVDQYIAGYLDKVASNQFYTNRTQPIQSALKTVPVFTIINGNGEIVLNKPSKDLSSKTFKTVFNEKLYDFCGDFDQTAEKKQQFGLFFMNRLDAETYLKAIAQSDIDGTQTVGLSINCIGLDSAYKITREYHPGIDFRFVPDLKEVQNFLTNYVRKGDVIVENEQQQITFQRKAVNLLPFLDKIGLRVSQSVGASSFAQRDEFFKGVPVYIVQVQESQRNILSEQYFKVSGTLDSIFGKITQSANSLIGMGDSHIIQGSLNDTPNQEKFVNYIFFEQTQAAEFVKQHGRQSIRYKGSEFLNTNFLIRKSQIFSYNLEDFIESWEDKISSDLINVVSTNSIHNTKATFFVSPTSSAKEVLQYQQEYKQTPLKNILQGFSLKLRVLKRNIAVFTSID